MARFRYKAATLDGEVLEGELDARSQDAAVRRLQDQGYVPVLAEEVTAGAPVRRAGLWRRRARITDRELGLLTTELAALLGCGLALDRALDMLSGFSRERAVGDVLSDLHTHVRRGADLSVAMGHHPGVFSRAYVNMVRAGEASGTLHLALERVAEYLERARRLRETLVSALMYPALLLAFCVISVSVILGVVIPKISDMFSDAGQELPALTRAVVLAGSIVHEWWWAIGGCCAGAWLYARWRLRDPAVRASRDRRLLALPYLGDLISKHEAARFTRMLAVLMRGGVPLLEALNLARQSVSNRAVDLALRRVARSVRQGRGLARPLLEAGVFPRLPVNLLQVGEESGNLESMLVKAADLCDRDVYVSLKRTVDIVGPLLILALAVLIGTIVMSVLVAVLGVNELAF